MPSSPELAQNGPTREHLRRAHHHLDLARDLLDRLDPEFRAAAVHIVESFREALAAVNAWHCVRLPAEADVREHASHAVGFASILRTPANRALADLATLRAVGTKERLSVHDREAVETAWYTARNLYRTASGEVPADARTGVEIPGKGASGRRSNESAGRTGATTRTTSAARARTRWRLTSAEA